MRRRIIAGMGANSLGVAITIVIQLLSLPIFLYFWDASKYGAWLVLSAIPAYLSMTDIGMVTATGNKMTMAMGRNDLIEANRVFQSAQLFMLIVCGGVALLLIPAVIWIPLPDTTSILDRVALAILSITILIGLLGGLNETIFRSTGRFAIGTLFGSGLRLGEWLGSMLGLFLVGSFAAVALGGLLARLAGTLGAIHYSRSGEFGLKWGFTDANTAEIREMLKPAVAFMAFPFANALSFQGVTLLVGMTLGTTAVATFNTYRTIARMAVQFTGVFSQALTPEFSRLFGYGGSAAVKQLWLRSVKLGLSLAIGMSLVLYLASPYLLTIWTHGQIAFDPRLMELMLLYAAVGGAWHISRSILSAINRPVEMAMWSIVTSVLVIGMAWLLGNKWQLYGVTIAMLISEVLIASICTHLAYRAVFNNPN